MKITLQQLEDALSAYDQVEIGYWFLSPLFRPTCIDQLHNLVSEYKEKAPNNKDLDVACMLAAMGILAQEYHDDKNKKAAAFIKQQIPLLESFSITYATLTEHDLLKYLDEKKKNHYFAIDIRSALSYMSPTDLSLTNQNRLTPANFQLLLNISPTNALCRFNLAKLIVELDKQNLLTPEYSASLVTAIQQDTQQDTEKKLERLDEIMPAYLQNKDAIGLFIPALLQHSEPMSVVAVINILDKCDVNFLKSNTELQSKLFALSGTALENLKDQLLSCPAESQLERLSIFIQEPAVYLCDLIAREMRRLPPKANSAECFAATQAILTVNAGDLEAAQKALGKHVDEVSKQMREQIKKRRELDARVGDTEAQVKLSLFQPEAIEKPAATNNYSSSLQFSQSSTS